MLIVAGRTRLDRVFAQQRVDSVSVQVGKFVQPGLGLGGGGEDAPDGGQGEGAEADGALEGGTHVVTLVLGDQGQELLGLQFALDLLGRAGRRGTARRPDRVRRSAAARAVSRWLGSSTG